jgi:hypothetical protein
VSDGGRRHRAARTEPLLGSRRRTQRAPAPAAMRPAPTNRRRTQADTSLARDVDSRRQPNAAARCPCDRGTPGVLVRMELDSGGGAAVSSPMQERRGLRSVPARLRCAPGRSQSRRASERCCLWGSGRSVRRGVTEPRIIPSCLDSVVTRTAALERDSLLGLDADGIAALTDQGVYVLDRSWLVRWASLASRFPPTTVVTWQRWCSHSWIPEVAV